MQDINNSINFNCDYEKDSNDITKKYKSKLTLNSHGMMFPLINPYFTQVMELMDKSKKVADLGVAYGLTTKKLLENGFDKVIANDLEEKHLQDLWETTPQSFRSRLELIPGNVLNLEFDNDSFGGIIAIRWLQFIHGDDVRKVFRKFYDWLEPGGYLMCVVPTPFFYMCRSLWTYDSVVKRKFIERIKNKSEWPGEFYSKDLFPNDETLTRNMPEKMNLFTNEVLIREAVLAGFEVLKCEYFGLDYEKGVYLHDCTRREEASIICYKRNF